MYCNTKGVFCIPKLSFLMLAHDQIYNAISTLWYAPKIKLADLPEDMYENAVVAFGQLLSLLTYIIYIHLMVVNIGLNLMFANKLSWSS